jgi:hypothetical protein
MNESLFAHGAFDRARPLAKPDFEVMMTLASLRQVNSPTARLAIARPGGATPSDGGGTMTMLAGLDAAAARPGDGVAAFYDLSHLAASAFWPLAGSEGAVNLGVSTYLQSQPLDESDRP